MKLFYVPIVIGLLTLAADAMDQGGGRWRHHGGGHHGKGGGGGHCKRGDAQGCGNISLTAKFEAGSVSPALVNLESPLFKPVEHVKENVDIELKRRWHSPVTPGMVVTYRILKYDVAGKDTGTFIDGQCDKIPDDFAGGRIHMTFSKNQDGWYNCVLSNPK